MDKDDWDFLWTFFDFFGDNKSADTKLLDEKDKLNAH